MNRHFPDSNVIPPEEATPGASALAGPCTCDWRQCGGEMAERERFAVLVIINRGQPGEQSVSVGAFCSAECAASYNRFVCLFNGLAERDARHAALEHRHGRRITLVPRTATHNRLDWLRECRAGLTPAEQAVAERELLVVAAGVTRRK